jgi:hypothetical protein
VCRLSQTAMDLDLVASNLDVTAPVNTPF